MADRGFWARLCTGLTLGKRSPIRQSIRNFILLWNITPRCLSIMVPKLESGAHASIWDGIFADCQGLARFDVEHLDREVRRVFAPRPRQADQHGQRQVGHLQERAFPTSKSHLRERCSMIRRHAAELETDLLTSVDRIWSMRIIRVKCRAVL